jgi:hypothetical protein
MFTDLSVSIRNCLRGCDGKVDESVGYSLRARTLAHAQWIILLSDLMMKTLMDTYICTICTHEGVRI